MFHVKHKITSGWTGGKGAHGFLSFLNDSFARVVVWNLVEGFMGGVRDGHGF